MPKPAATPVRLKMLRNRYAKTADSVDRAIELPGVVPEDKTKIAELMTQTLREAGQTYSFHPSVARTLVNLGVAEFAETIPAREELPKTESPPPVSGKKK